MTEARFRIIAVGPHVTVQDGGRAGMLRFGVPMSGPMDRLAFARAQQAVGNAPDAAGIEVSLGGLSLECTAGAVDFAVAGGGFIVQQGADVRGSWTQGTLRAGERLTIRPGPWGSWTCLAFAGNLVAPQWLGSAATHGPSGMGGGALQAGAEVVVEGARQQADRVGRLVCPVQARPRHRVRVVIGPQVLHFSPDAITDFLSETFYLTTAYDRMGVRLRGLLLPPNGPLTMPSAPVVRGSVQVAGDGVATVLLADHQTTGGYPRIATILSGDLDGFCQLRPQDAVTFEAISPEEAGWTVKRQRVLAGLFHRNAAQDLAKPEHF